MMLNLKKLTPEQLDRYITGLEKIVEIIDNANVQLPLPFEPSDGSVAEDLGATHRELSGDGMQLTSEARDGVRARFQETYGTGALATPELNEALLDEVIRHADLHISVEKLADEIEADGKRLLARYLGVPYVA